MKRCKQSVYILLFSFFALPLSLWADDAAKTLIDIELGKDYQIIKGYAERPSPSAEDKILVQEFFSYGCSWCAQIDPKFEAWRKQQPAYVQIQKIPVLFKSGWELYAKAYYTSEALGLEHKITPSLFNNIINERKELKTVQEMIDFFKAQGVDSKTADKAFKSSMAIDSRVAQANKIMRDYQIYVIPSIVIDGKYMTNLSLAKANSNRLMDILDALVAKVKAEKNISLK